MMWLMLAWIWALVCLVRRNPPLLAGEQGRARLSPGLTTGLLIALLALMAGFTALTALAAQDGDAGVFPLMTCLGAVDVMLVCLPCIRWDAEGLTVRNALGLTRHIPWADVRGWYADGSNRWLKLRRGRILLSPVTAGREALLAAAAANCLDPDETPLPLIPDLFRGKTAHPARLLAVLTLCGLIGLVMIGQGAYLLATANAAEDNTQQSVVAFDSFRQNRSGHFSLYTGEDAYYVPGAADSRELMALCGTGEAVNVWTRPGHSGLAVCRAVGADGRVYLDFWHFNADQGARAAAELLGGLILGGYALASAWVWRWPEKCSSGVRRVFCGPWMKAGGTC